MRTKADLDDSWKKLRTTRLLSYLKETASLMLKLRLTVEFMNVVKW